MDLLLRSTNYLRKLWVGIGVKAHLAREILHELNDVHRSLRVQPGGGLIQQEHLQVASSFQIFGDKTENQGKDVLHNSAQNDFALREPFGHFQMTTSGGIC